MILAYLPDALLFVLLIIGAIRCGSVTRVLLLVAAAGEAVGTLASFFILSQKEIEENDINLYYACAIIRGIMWILVLVAVIIGLPGTTHNAPTVADGPTLPRLTARPQEPGSDPKLESPA